MAHLDWQTFFAGGAVLVAGIGVFIQVRQAESRSQWESDQTTRRENFEKRQLQKQQEWQANQDAQRQRERQEDLKRIELESRPQVRVSVENGLRQWGPMVVQTLFITAQNVGRVPVYLDAPMIHTPDDHYLHFVLDGDINFANWETAHYSPVTFPVVLQPTQSCGVQLNRKSIEHALAEDFAGSIEIVGVYRDGASNLYSSAPYLIDLDQPSDTGIAAS